MVVIYNGDESDNFEGLRIDASGNLETVKVDETFAIQNEVWVISLNENHNAVNAKNTYQKRPRSNAYVGDCVVTPSGDRASTSWQDMRMNYFQITCRKETWAAGDSDVYIARFAGYEKFINPATGNPFGVNWIGANDYTSLLSVDDDLVGHCYEMDYIAYHGMNPDDNVANAQGAKGDIFFFLIFEHDNWPAGNHNQTVSYTNQYDYPPAYTSLDITYRSTETPYNWGVVTAKPIYRNCTAYFGCTYYGEQVCDAYSVSGCSEVSWKTGS